MTDLTMRTSPETNDLFGALIKAQAMLANPIRNRTVKVETREKGSYAFTYATLDNIVDAIRTPLAENGLAFLQFVVSDAQDRFYVVTRVVHASGQWMETDMPVFIGGNGAQAFGSGVSYAKRYALTAMLGIVSEGDDDANIADGNSVRVRERRMGRRNTDPIGDAQVTARTTDAHLLTNGGTQSQYQVDKVAREAKKATYDARWAKSNAGSDWLQVAKAEISRCSSPPAIDEWERQNKYALEAMSQFRAESFDWLESIKNDKLDSLRDGVPY